MSRLSWLDSKHSYRSTGERPTEPVHFIQMWVVPDEAGITPGYEQLEGDNELLSGGLVTVASGMDRHKNASAIRIQNRNAALYAARLRPGQRVPLPDAPYLHLFVARGSVDLEGTGTLAQGDTARFTATGGHQVSATQPPEILLWEMRATATTRPSSDRHGRTAEAQSKDAGLSPACSGSGPAQPLLFLARFGQHTTALDSGPGRTVLEHHHGLALVHA